MSMFEINVNIKFPDLLLATSAISKALMSVKHGDPTAEASAAVPAPMEKTPVSEAQTTNAQTPPVATATPTAVPTSAPSYTLDQLTKAGAELAQGGKITQLQELLSRYGVQALPQLPPDSYGAVANDLRAMGAQL